MAGAEVVDLCAWAARVDGLNDSADRWAEEAAASGSGARVVVGYSMGARLAMHLVVRHSDLVRAAVLVSGHPGLADDSEREARRVEDAAVAARFRDGDLSEALAWWERRPVFGGGVPVPSWVPLLRASWEEDRSSLAGREREGARSLEVFSLGNQGDLRDALRASSVPILWVTGDADAKFTALGVAVAEGVPGMRHAIIPGAGHRVPWEEPEYFCRTAKEWLAGLDGKL